MQVCVPGSAHVVHDGLHGQRKHGRGLGARREAHQPVREKNRLPCGERVILMPTFNPAVSYDDMRQVKLHKQRRAAHTRSASRMTISPVCITPATLIWLLGTHKMFNQPQMMNVWLDVAGWSSSAAIWMLGS